MGEGKGVYRGLVGKPEGRRPLGRPRRRWEDNIRMDLWNVAGMGRMRIEYKVAVGKSEGKRAAGRRRRRW